MRGIYVIIHISSGRVYVGSSTKDIEERWLKGHRPYLRAGTHFNPILQRAWNKYGEGDFEWTPFQEMPNATDQEIIDAEGEAIRALGAEFNIVRDPTASPSLDPSVREKIARTLKGRGKGRKLSKETRRKMSAARKGKPLSEEHKEKLRIAARGRKMKPEHIEAMRKSLTGRKQSAETCAKRSAALKGKPWSPARRAAQRK